MGSSVRLIWLREFDSSAAFRYNENIGKSPLYIIDPEEAFPGCNDGSSKSEKDSSTERRLRRLLPEARRPLCFTSKAINRRSKRPNIARVSISKDGWVVNPHIPCSLLKLAFSTHFNITRPGSRMRANIPDVSHRDVASRPGAGAKRTGSGPFAGRPRALNGRWDNGGLVAINWRSWGCSIPREESRKLDTGSHNSLPRKLSEPWLSRG